MHPSGPSTESVGTRPAPNPQAILLIAFLWLTFACGLPLHQLHEARRQAHNELIHTLTTDKPDQASVIAAFDSSNEAMNIAAFGPCLMLAVTIIFLIHQMLKLKRRYDALEREMRTSQEP